jgi:DNA modification methylase
MPYAMNQIIHGDSYDILPTLPDKSFDTIIIDPPYGMGIDTWDTPVDVAFFTEQIKRIGKEFYAVFGQMPYLDEWHDEAKRQGFHFLEHISWVKRHLSPSVRLSRTHEEIYIYAISKKRGFYQTSGRYEDVKIPGILFDIVTIDGIQRHISSLQAKLNGKSDQVRRMVDSRNIVYERFPKSSNRSPEYANFTNVWSFLPETCKVKHKRFHCTTKSSLAVTRLVEMLTPEYGSVLDCFSGSGTTAIACKRLNRNFLCIEKEQDFYEHSLERLEGDIYQPELELNTN